MFDTAEGREEVLESPDRHQRVGRYSSLFRVVDAQREYAKKDRDGDKMVEYAQSFRSDAGKKNGLYWAVNRRRSMVGLARRRAAAKRGYGQNELAPDEPPPYRGYYFKSYRQGKNAAGGAYSYVVKGNLMGGFALVAYPPEYRNSGVMTFIVNHKPGFSKGIKSNTLSRPGDERLRPG